MATAFICEECPRSLECLTCGNSFPFVKSGCGRLPRYCSDECRNPRKPRPIPKAKVSIRTEFGTCSTCSEIFQGTGQRGRMPQHCSPACKAAIIRPTPKANIHKACVVCGAAFSTYNRRTETCGRACGKIKGDIARVDRVRRERTRACETCGATFVMGNPSGRARSGKIKEGRYCSRACSADGKRAAFPHSTVTISPCGQCSRLSVYKGSRARRYCSDVCRVDAKEPRVHVPRSFICRQCSIPYATRPGEKANTYCSRKCRKAAARMLAIASGSRAASRKARKLKQRGVTVELVNAVRILERDNWTCQLCGVKTPRKLRGTFDDRAPEVDHIRSLAEGGEHSYRNVQCACRKCNLAKSGRSKGQMLLFG